MTTSLGAELGEEQDVADAWLIGENHYQTVDAEPETRGGRHAILQGSDIVCVIGVRRFGVAGFGRPADQFRPPAV